MTIKEKLQFNDETFGMASYEKLLYKLLYYNNKQCADGCFRYKLHSEEIIDFNRLMQEKLIKVIAFLDASNFTYICTDKGKTFFDKQKPKEKYDLFISHANADKISYVNDLYENLNKLGLNIFYDKESIDWGDKWKEKILNGVEKSEFAIIVISENFFGREWTEKELASFLNRQNTSGQKIILPILYNITVQQLKEKHPLLADIQTILSTEKSKEEITIMFAEQYIKRLKDYS